MPALPSTFIRTSLLFLIAGFILGGWMMLSYVYKLPVHPGLRLVHMHFLTVGFFTLMVMGVSLWMFPAPPGHARTEIAKRAPWGWWAYGLLVGGLLLRAVVEFLPVSLRVGPLHWLTLLSATIQVAAACCFGVAIWDRTRARQYLH